MPKKILLAEDSLTIQKVFELTFAQSDFALTMVDNGVDAVRLAAEILPDLVIADVTLPGRTGFEVASDLSGVRGCPVLVLSGSLGPFDEETFKSSGARGVLFKPFESQELIDKVNEMLSAAEVATEASAGQAAAPGTEEWDFSDVLEEVEGGPGKPPAAFLQRDVPPGAPVAGDAIELDEFDVSLEEIEAPEQPPAPESGNAPGLLETEAVVAEPPFTIETPCEDEPAGITDISPALASVEELEEIEDLEEMELLHKETEGPLAVEPPPAPAAAPESEAVVEEEAELALEALDADFESCAMDEGEPEHDPEVALQPEEDLEAIAEPAPVAVPVPPAGANAEIAAAEALREQFSARAREIVEKVATEAVEKVMWEWMDRLSIEFTERIRESVESVAWDVIPKTAEALIRDEIARIRQQEGKQGESR
ncbi:MAG TPA: response regulator [Candidatus Deferrimicrobiaceae bacterium]|jgi:CheY-like chemotaxis protein